MKVLLVSGTGFLGGHLARHFAREGVAFRATARDGELPLDLARPVAPQLRDVLAHERFTHAVICAAMADVDACFRHPRLSSRVNVDAVAELVHELARFDVLPVFFSTDLVFGGGADLYREGDPVSPGTLYGRQKATSEELVRGSGKHIVFRTSKLMAADLHPRNILTPIVRAGRGDGTYRAFTDQWITPVFCEDVARYVTAALRAGLEGTYHLAGVDRLSRLELARRACEALGLDASRIGEARLADLALAEPRGSYNTLSAERIRHATGIAPTPLAEGLARLRASL